MSRELKVLYTIFELELSPPFRLRQAVLDPNRFSAFSRCAKYLGDYYDDRIFYLADEPESTILNRIKQTFGVEKLSNDDLHHITKHLFFWLKKTFDKEIYKLTIFCRDTDGCTVFEGE